MVSTNLKDRASRSGNIVLKRLLTGAAIGLALISLFFISGGAGDPSWGKYWMIRPLIIVPLAGAGGGLFFYLLEQMAHRGGWMRFLALFLGVLGFIVALWLGSVLGLNGTYWN